MGRPLKNENKRRHAYIEKFKLKPKAGRTIPRILTHQLCDQLDLCKSDLARRLILGVRS